MNNKSKKGLLVNIALLFTVLILLSAAIESGLRVYARGETDICTFDGFKKANMGEGIYRVSDNPDLIIELNPGAMAGPSGEKLRSDAAEATIKINASAMREDREYAIPKPPNTYRIAVLGDSATFGWGIEAKTTYPKILEGILREQWHGKNIEVINFAVPGYNGKQKVVTLKEKAAGYEPDLVLVGWLVDDYTTPSYFFLSKLPLPDSTIRFLNANSYIFACVREGLANAVNLIDSTTYKEQYKNGGHGQLISKEFFKELGDFSNDKNIPIVVIILPVWQEWNKNVSDGIVSANYLLKEMAIKNGLYAIDALPLIKNLEERSENPMTFYTISKTDVFHPNPAGNIFLTPMIYNYLIEETLVPLTRFIAGVKMEKYELAEKDKSPYDFAYEYGYYYKSK